MQILAPPPVPPVLPASPVSPPPRRGPRRAGPLARLVLALLVLVALVIAIVGMFAIRFGWLGGLPFSVPADGSDATIEQVIQQADNEQIQALASQDPSVMADTATPQHYQELLQVNQQLVTGGVASIALDGIDWGAISVNGTSATAVDYETWTTTYADSSTLESRDENDYSLVQQNGAWVISADANPTETPSAPSGSTGPSSGAPAPSGPAPSAPAPSGSSPSGAAPSSSAPSGSGSGSGSGPSVAAPSRNWAGYAAIGGQYTAVSGTWSLPPYDSTEAGGLDATWVGIGGIQSTDLLQAGTQEQTSGTGQTQYSAWIETLPRPSQTVPLSVHAGDSISVSLTEQSPGMWQVAMTNNTTGQQWQTNVQYQSSNSSAEWIEEAPSAGRGGVLPLDNFGMLNISDATTVSNGQSQNLTQAGARAIDIDSGSGQALVTTSPLGSDGSSFSVTRTATPDTQPAGRTSSPHNQSERG
jgi:hypothetical protein